MFYAKTTVAGIAALLTLLVADTAHADAARCIKNIQRAESAERGRTYQVSETFPDTPPSIAFAIIHRRLTLDRWNTVGSNPATNTIKAVEMEEVAKRPPIALMISIEPSGNGSIVHNSFTSSRGGMHPSDFLCGPLLDIDIDP